MTIAELQDAIKLTAAKVRMYDRDWQDGVTKALPQKVFAQRRLEHLERRLEARQC